MKAHGCDRFVKSQLPLWVALLGVMMVTAGPVRAEEAAGPVDPNQRDAIPAQDPAGTADPNQKGTAEGPVLFADGNLKAAVEAALGVSDPNAAQMQLLTSLDANRRGITDLSGLETATHLGTLYLRSNLVSDLSSLAQLRELKSLWLGGNLISDVAPLANLTQLATLDLTQNSLTDISPLSRLASLAGLDLTHNRISDISPLASLTGLTILGLSDNPVADLTALGKLSKLRDLGLNYCRVKDLAPLLTLQNLKMLALLQNPLGREAYATQLAGILAANPYLPGGLTYSPNLNPVGSVSATAGKFPNKVVITWQALSGGPLYSSDFRYSVYRAASRSGVREPLAKNLKTTTFEDTTALPGTQYWYWVGSDNTDEMSEGDEGWCQAGVRRKLEVSATAGGDVTSPGIGAFEYASDDVVQLEAKARPSFQFVGWSGSLSSSSRLAFLKMDADKEVRANFASLADVLYVAAAGRDANEDGTARHPFHSIQQALDVARDDARIVVGAGVYHEKIDFLGKNVSVIASWLFDPNVLSEPVIDPCGTGPAVTFAAGENSRCTLAGVRIRGAVAGAGAALWCRGSSPIIAQCIICGNRSTDKDGSIIACSDSQAAFINCTIAQNVVDPAAAVVRCDKSGIVVSSSILWGNQTDPLKTDAPAASFALTGGSAPTVLYSDIKGGCAGKGNIDADPLFAARGQWQQAGDPNRPSFSWLDGDYHLQSTAGCYSSARKAWIVGEVTSPCIDAGCPTCDNSAEPQPNGSRIDMGAYGSTGQASKSPRRN